MKQEIIDKKREIEGCLNYDPLDDNECKYNPIKDNLVRSRFDYVCVHCESEIKKGDVCRKLEVSESITSTKKKVHRFRYCFDCCKAMANDMDTCTTDYFIGRKMHDN